MFLNIFIVQVLAIAKMRFSARINMCEVVDKGDPTVDYHGTELDRDNEGIHCQKEKLKGLCGEVKVLELRELKCVEQDDPHDVD